MRSDGFHPVDEGFYVDCEGYDTNGNMLFEELQNCTPATLPGWVNNDDWYYTEDNWGNNILTASPEDFSHCEQCNRCEPYRSSKLVNHNSMVSFFE